VVLIREIRVGTFKGKKVKEICVICEICVTFKGKKVKNLWESVRSVGRKKRACHEAMTHPLYFYDYRDLELCVLWCTWEWNHVTDVLHTGYKENQTLETETETCMWT